jgi:hypothetical protein
MAVSLKSDLILLGGSIALRQGSADPTSGGGVAGNIGDLYFRTTNFQLYQKTTAPNTGWIYLSPQDLFGNGADGDVIVAANLNNTRDQYYNNLTIQNTFTFDPRGYRIFVRDTLTVDPGGAISVDGTGGGPTGTAGAGSPPGASTLCTSGLSGGAGAAAGAAANGGTSPQVIQGFTGTGGAGGSGNGGLSAGGSGGAANVQPVASQGNPRSQSQAAFQMVGGITAIRTSPGAGGGGGGGDGTAGGGGGGGAGLIMIFARKVINNGSITARGGNGGSPPGGNRGGGGGGGGGLIIIGTHSFTGNTPLVTKGSGGVKQGNGVNGSDGADGLYIPLKL